MSKSDQNEACSIETVPILQRRNTSFFRLAGDVRKMVKSGEKDLVVDFTSKKRFLEITNSFSEIPPVDFRQIVAQIIHKNKEDLRNSAKLASLPLKSCLEKWKSKDFNFSVDDISRSLNLIADILKNGNFASDSDFGQYIISHANERADVCSLMNEVLEYVAFLEPLDQDKRNRAFLSFPPSAAYLKCVPGTVNRIRFLHETQASPFEVASVVEAHDRVIRQAIDRLKNVVYSGNEEHITTYLEYVLGILSEKEAQKQDKYFMSPASEISCEFLIDFLARYDQEVKKIMAEEMKRKISHFSEVLLEAFKSSRDNEEQIDPEECAQKFCELRQGRLDAEEEMEFAGALFEKLRDECFVHVQGGKDLTGVASVEGQEGGEYYGLVYDELEKYVFQVPKDFLDAALKVKQEKESGDAVDSLKLVRYRSGFFFTEAGGDHLKKLLNSPNGKDRDFAVDVLWILSRASNFGNAPLHAKNVFLQAGVDAQSALFYKRLSKDDFPTVVTYDDIFKALLMPSGDLPRNAVKFTSHVYFVYLLFNASYEEILEFLKSDGISKTFFNIEEDFDDFAKCLDFLLIKGIRISSVEINHCQDICLQFLMRGDASNLLPAMINEQFVLDFDENGQPVHQPKISDDFLGILAFLAARYDKMDLFGQLKDNDVAMEESNIFNKYTFRFQIFYKKGSTNCGKNIFHYLCENGRFEQAKEFLAHESFLNHDNRNLFFQLDELGKAPIHYASKTKEGIEFLASLKNVLASLRYENGSFAISKEDIFELFAIPDSSGKTIFFDIVKRGDVAGYDFFKDLYILTKDSLIDVVYLYARNVAGAGSRSCLFLKNMMEDLKLRDNILFHRDFCFSISAKARKIYNESGDENRFFDHDTVPPSVRVPILFCALKSCLGSESYLPELFLEIFKQEDARQDSFDYSVICREIYLSSNPFRFRYLKILHDKFLGGFDEFFKFTHDPVQDGHLDVFDYLIFSVRKDGFVAVNERLAKIKEAYENDGEDVQKMFDLLKDRMISGGYREEIDDFLTMQSKEFKVLVEDIGESEFDVVNFFERYKKKFQDLDETSLNPKLLESDLKFRLIFIHLETGIFRGYCDDKLCDVMNYIISGLIEDSLVTSKFDKEFIRCFKKGFSDVYGDVLCQSLKWNQERLPATLRRGASFSESLQDSNEEVLLW